MRVLRWLRLVLVSLVAASLVGSMFGGVASGAAADWKAALAGLADDPYVVNAIAYKERIGQALPAASTDDLGDERVAEVVSDAARRYVDGARFHSEADGRAAYASDLHLASWLGSRLAAQASGNELPALKDLLMAGRLTADAAIQDAEAALRVPEVTTTGSVSVEEEAQRVEDVEGGVDLLASAGSVVTPEGVTAATRELELARRDYGKALDALGKSLPVSASTHFGLAWRHGYNALVHLGVSYDGDRDQDGVMDRTELILGSSPLRADSDGDGLTDRFEIDALLTHSLPGSADTDGDGVRDGDEDLDGDGLTALAEQRAGSMPTEKDTDRDGFTDAEELTHGTQPAAPDSDADGLLDGIEPRTGTSPLDNDSDDDSILDGDETLRQQVSGVDGITATLVGSGDLVSTFRVAKVTTDARMVGVGGQVGPAYDFSLAPPAADGLDQAELNVPYDPATIGASNPADLRLFYFDPAKNVWRPASDVQAVDQDRQVVTATVTHFSTYAIFDIANWGETWTAQDNPCRTRGDGGTDVVLLDLALVLDSSGSMSWNDPLGLRRTAAKNFVDALLPEDRAGVVDFDSWAYVTQQLTTDHTAVKAAIDRIDSNGGTNIAAGVQLGNQILINNGDPARARMAILLTDGEGYYNHQLTQEAKLAGITIYTIGLGPNVDEALLASIASETGGRYHQVATADELPEVFRRISEDTGGDPRAAKDTDEDGLNDCVEIEGALAGDFNRYTSDPLDKDTDGDGLEDGEEIGQPVALDDILGPWVEPSANTIYDVFSDPQSVDSDSDQLADPLEMDLGLDPFTGDSDHDGLTDGLEVDTIGSAPDAGDTDGDELGDAYEHAHRVDQGLDPLFFDEQVSAWTYALHFAQGAILGDLWRHDSLAWLAGNLASGASSFIPVVGWVVGGIADLRDAIGSAIHADWVGSGLSVVGVLPYAGDAVAIPGKAVKFVLRNPQLADESLHFISKLDDVPTEIKVKAAKEVLGSSWDELINRGFSESTLVTLQKGRTDLDAVADAMKHSRHVTGSAASFFAKGKDGEVFLEGLYGATTKGVDKQVWASTKGYIGRGRFFDVLVDAVAHESKVGFVKWSKSIENQIKKDAWLVQQGQIDSAHWHLFASSSSNTIGADSRVLDLLNQYGIPFTVHVP